MSLLEHTIIPSSVTHQNIVGNSINSTSIGSHEVNATSAESQHVSTVSVHGDMHQVASVSSTGRLIKLVGLVTTHPAVIMVDCRSTGDFISQTYVSEYKLYEYRYKRSKSVWLADGKHHTVSTYIECQMDIGEMS